MFLTVYFHEIESLILARSGVEISIRCFDKDEIRLQPRNMGFIKNRVKVSVKIDRTYSVPNRLKIKVSAGVWSKLVVPKVMAMLDHLPEGCVSRQKDGVVYILFDKIPYLERVCGMCEISDVVFDSECNNISLIGSLSLDESNEKDAGQTDDVPEDCMTENLSVNEQRARSTVSEIAHAIFESDAVDEGLQTLRDKATELKDTHGDELRDAALSFVRDIRNHWTKKASDDDAPAE